MFGPFFVARPDFELENFSPRELLAVALRIRREEEIDGLPSAEELLGQVDGATSGKEFFAALKGTLLESVEKGDRWGSALMNHALENEHLPAEHRGAGQRRQVLEVAQLIVRARRSGYQRSLASSKVAPVTGEIVPR
jgi:hypothetical protein